MADEEDENPQPIYEDDEPDSRIFRWMSALIVILAVAGFFGLAWYAYKSGGDSVDEKDVELVKADTTPVKEAPANPGGMQIPNQDKTVYGLISGKTEKPVVEHILPAPEEPMARASGDTETWMSDSLKSKENADDSGTKPTLHADGTPMTPKEQFNPAKVRNAASVVTGTATGSGGGAPSEVPMKVAAVTPQSLPPIPPAASAPSAPPAPNSSTGMLASNVPPQPKPPAPPAAPPVKQAPAASDDSDDDTPKTPPAKPAAATPAVTPPAPAAAAPPAGVRVQLGSYKSQGEAESNWKKIAVKFSDDVGGKQHYVVRADLGSKGVYYRLQLAPFASSSDAEQFCIDFVSAGQGCIVARGK